MKVVRCAARWNRSDKLRDFGVNQHAIPAIAGRHCALIRKLYDRLWYLTSLTRSLRAHDKKRFRTTVLDAKRLAGTDKNAGLGLNLRSEEHTSELQSQSNLVCRLL